MNIWVVKIPKTPHERLKPIEAAPRVSWKVGKSDDIIAQRRGCKRRKRDLYHGRSLLYISI